MYTLRFDGIFWEAPSNANTESKAGFMGYGWLIWKGNTLVGKGHGVFARGINANSSIAEYLALIEGLEALRDLGVKDEHVQVLGDAKGVIDQMEGLAAVNSPSIKPLYRRAEKIANYFMNLHWKWTPRRHNREADQLTRRAMRQIHFYHDNYQAAVNAIQNNLTGNHKRGRFLPLLDLRVFQPAV
jgi:ribonuclease HI